MQWILFELELGEKTANRKYLMLNMYSVTFEPHTLWPWRRCWWWYDFDVLLEHDMAERKIARRKQLPKCVDFGWWMWMGMQAMSLAQWVQARKHFGLIISVLPSHSCERKPAERSGMVWSVSRCCELPTNMIIVFECESFTFYSEIM